MPWQQNHLRGLPPSVDAPVMTSQRKLVEVDANAYHTLIAAVVILSTITGCFLVITIFRCFFQRTSPPVPSTVVDVEKSPQRVLILPSRRSVITHNRTSWTTASTFNKPSIEESGREEPGSPQQSSQSYFERHRTSREIVLLPPPAAIVRDRPISTENPLVHTEQLEEKIPVVVPSVNLEHSSSIRFSRMDHPNWTPAGDVPPPIPVQVACKREMAARATYEADHPKLKRAYTHGRCGVLGPLAKRIALRKERAMSIPGASSPQNA